MESTTHADCNYDPLLLQQQRTTQDQLISITKDEVDFISTAGSGNGGAVALLDDGATKYKYNNNNNNVNNNNNSNCNNNNEQMHKQQEQQQQQQQQQQQNNCHISNESVPKIVQNTSSSSSSSNNNSKNKDNNSSANTNQKHEKRSSTKERLSIFSFGKKIGQKTQITQQKQQQQQQQQQEQNGKMMNDGELSESSTLSAAAPARQHKFVKSSSLSRLLGNTYNAKKHERDEQKRQQAAAAAATATTEIVTNQANGGGGGGGGGKFNTYGGRRRLSGPHMERAKKYSKEEGDAATTTSASTANAEQQRKHNNNECDDDDDLWLLHSAASAVAQRSDEDILDHFRELSHTNVVGGSGGGGGGGGGSSDGGGVGSNDLGVKAMRTLSRGLGRLWWRRTHSVNISTPDPEFKVAYLGNVLTGWAKGEGSIEKQLNTLWRNYTQHSKPDVIMRMRVCASGLKATTRQHGLTEYWANRITHCCAPRHFPRIFCWIYRHEGRKLKHELRCHAVLCSKEKIAQEICATLKENLESALREFKRDKILKQNARLSLANAAYDNPSMPRRKILLSVGGNNYRPPLERSKSAPKLMAIEEAIGEEGEEEVEDTNEPEMKPCCQKDSLYPAMTLGRRRCRRGHSIRRTGKVRATFSASSPVTCEHHHYNNLLECGTAAIACNDDVALSSHRPISSGSGDGSDDSDDFEKLLKHNDYDSTAPLANELLPYFDKQLHQHIGSNSLGNLRTTGVEDEEPLSLLMPTTINSDPSAGPHAEFDPTAADGHDEDEVEPVGLRRQGVCSDGEEDYLDADDMYFRQASILNMLHRHSMRKITISSDENSSIEMNVFHHHHQGQSSISSNASTSTANSISTQGSSAAVSETGSPHPLTKAKQLLNPDSDEGSISSGCETASTATTNQDDLSLQYQPKHQNKSLAPLCDLIASGNEEPITAEEIYQRLESRLQGRHNSDATTFSSSSSITLKLNNSPATSVIGLDANNSAVMNSNASSNNTGNNASNGISAARNRRTRRTQREQRANSERNSDSECSDESGYVEFQEQDKNTAAVISVKPQPPPKPMPRKLLMMPNGSGTNSNTASASTAV